GVRRCRTALAAPLSGAGAELARSDSPRLSDSVALKQLRPRLPARRPGCGPHKSPRSPSARHGLAVKESWAAALTDFDKALPVGVRPRAPTSEAKPCPETPVRHNVYDHAPVGSSQPTRRPTRLPRSSTAKDRVVARI